MVQRSRRFDYALRALIDLAVEAGEERAQLREIAARQVIPEKYLEQLLRPLKAAGIVISMRGSRGGYQLGRPVTEISVLEVLEAVEGPLLTDDRAAAESTSARVVDEFWGAVTQGLSERLAQIGLDELVRRYSARRTKADNWVI